MKHPHWTGHGIQECLKQLQSKNKDLGLLENVNVNVNCIGGLFTGGIEGMVKTVAEKNGACRPLENLAKLGVYGLDTTYSQATGKFLPFSTQKKVFYQNSSSTP